MSISDVLDLLPEPTKQTFNRIQKLNRKLSKAKQAVLFNETCLNENILPNYTNIRIHDQRAKKQPFTEAFRKSLVEHQLKLKKEQVSELKQKLSILYDSFNESQIDKGTKDRLLSYLDEKVENAEHCDKESLRWKHKNSRR